MYEMKTINLPKWMPLSERIAWVSKELSEWLQTLDKPFQRGRDIVYLSSYHANGYYSYRYQIHREVEP